MTRKVRLFVPYFVIGLSLGLTAIAIIYGPTHSAEEAAGSLSFKDEAGFDSDDILMNFVPNTVLYFFVSNLIKQYDKDEEVAAVFHLTDGRIIKIDMRRLLTSKNPCEAIIMEGK
jgi:hypothetical protein